MTKEKKDLGKTVLKLGAGLGSILLSGATMVLATYFLEFALSDEYDSSARGIVFGASTIMTGLGCYHLASYTLKKE